MAGARHQSGASVWTPPTNTPRRAAVEHRHATAARRACRRPPRFRRASTDAKLWPRCLLTSRG